MWSRMERMELVSQYESRCPSGAVLWIYFSLVSVASFFRIEVGVGS
jgi:hypothetical protein